MTILKDEVKFFLYTHPKLDKSIHSATNFLRLTFCFCCILIRGPKRGPCTDTGQQMKCEKMSAIKFKQQACYVRRRRESLSMPGIIKYHPFMILPKTKTKKMDLQEPSPIFSKLPGELRAAIFEMVLTDAKRIYIRL